MLELLQRILQEVSRTSDLRAALQVMVQRLIEAIDTQACSIYLIDKKRSEYLLVAAEGINPNAVGKIRVGLDVGILGLVGKREEPINLEDATSHPNFFHHPEVGEEKYRAFLGVPIIHQRKLYGVLIVQQEESRRFDEAEEAFVVTLTLQLAPIIAHAEASGKLTAVTHLAQEESFEIEGPTLFGIPGSPGVGIGEAVVVFPPADLDAIPDREIQDIPAEIASFELALSYARDEISKYAERMKHALPQEENALFDVYLKILSRASLGGEVIAIIETGQWAQGALRQVIKSHLDNFESMEDEYIKERASDIKDLGLRILAHLQETQQEEISYPARTILIGEEISASALAAVPEGQLCAVVSSKGSSNSHVAILARALGVPAVMGARGGSCITYSARQLIVDGYQGHIYVSPSKKLAADFETLAREDRELTESLSLLRSKPAETTDGHRLSLQVNTGIAVASGLSLSVGAEGVGLYRSEIAFMNRDRFPTEEEQRVIYRQLLNAFAPRPVVIRTLDIGGDKSLPYFPVKEENPFLGWRGVRITLDHPNLFLVQIRAMIRANISLNNLQILLPMISRTSELDDSLKLIRQAYQEVQDEEKNVPFPPIGVMIEVPSAVYQAKNIASRVDFLSVGSNDLTQYILAVDRNNSRVANLYDSLHPAVLKAMLHVVEAGHSEGKRVSLCGEIAADPVAIIALLAMRFDHLSMNSTSLPRVKWVIRNFSLAAARK